MTLARATDKNVAILGGGEWGSTLARLVANNGYRVSIWSRHTPEAIAKVLSQADFIISAMSMAGVRPTLEKIEGLKFKEQAIFVTATKGLDPLTTLTPSQIWEQAVGDRSVVVLSGPNLAKEIQKGLPAATAVASKDLIAARQVQTIFASNTFRVYVNNDPLGTELGGTLKNVMAIASGVCDGLQLGTNAKAALLTRALPEMIRVGTCLGAYKETFFGLSGLGDLLATCNSPLSRNYQVGYRLAQNLSLEEILSELEGTAEGVNTTKVLISIAKKRHLNVPIAERVHQLLEGKISPPQALQALMERELKAEFYELDF
jgi:glycerol-3-phosphate dehydrogenase (NAD(P)+)